MEKRPVLSRRTFLCAGGAAVTAAALAGCAGSPASAPAAPEPPVTSPDEALRRLLEGNQRYVEQRILHVNQTAARRAEVATSQSPFATIVSCVDSRVPPEIVFDRGLGDLLVARSAGHVLDDALLGSVEFGVLKLRTPLVLVLGHERCGAIDAAIKTLESGGAASGHVRSLVDAIAPAVERARSRPGDLLDNAVRAQAELAVEQLRALPELAEVEQSGALRIVGAHYDLDTGVVQLLG